MSIYKSKNYENLSKHIKRRLKISCAYSISYLILEKFVSAKRPTDWQYICAKDLKERKIISPTSYKTFDAWRNDMVSKGILICMASGKDLKESKEPIYQASKFKYAQGIKKYIENELDATLYEKIDLKADDTRVDSLEKIIETKADNSIVIGIDLRVDRLEKKVEDLTALVLKAIPPDTPIRRKIVAENLQDQDKCFEELLKEQLIKENSEKAALTKKELDSMH